ncbi:hypothetical protein ACFSOZ_25945 [Mesorhizobium newzealandense]|uniref:Uncharacterized protein n=1 Tax=Mesorhizobium newzealandense TaxID=1300302 RepID=A0ABW4UEB6_9HYPH
MNMHVDTAYRFAIGQAVTHRDQPMPAVVVCRTRTSRGDELYGIRRRLDDCVFPELMILGEALVAA